MDVSERESDLATTISNVHNDLVLRTAHPPQRVSRRHLISNCTLGAFAGLQGARRAIAQTSGRVDHPRGQYSFLRGIPAYSAGVVARDGYEIVHAAFSRPLPLRAGFKAIDEHLSGINIPKIALCALELRSPQAFSAEEFSAFNSSYVEALRSWSILLEDGVNPIARTNVAPVLFPPSEPSIHAFSYAARSAVPQRTFVVAGGGELPDGPINPGDIIRRGETSSAAMLEKARYVRSRMDARLRTLGVSWPDVTAVNVYTSHDLSGNLVTEMLNKTGHNAVTWNYARPPIKDVEFEMDLRGVAREIVMR
jgi:hypothetical protein